VRITELPRTGSLTARRARRRRGTETTTIDYGGGLEVGHRRPRRRWQRRDGQDRHRPARFFSISRRNLWGKNRSVTLFGRVTVRRASRAATIRDEQAAYGFNDYRGLFHVPRAARVRHSRATRSCTTFVEQSRRTSFTFNRAASPLTTRASSAPSRSPAATPSTTRRSSTSRSTSKISC
jgi:hypothetical protein